MTLADRAIAEILSRGRRVLVVGGTGLYLRALRFGLVDAPARDESLRDRLRMEEEARPGALHERLLLADPVGAARIAPADHVRLIRALEVFEQGGVPLSRLHADHDRRPRHPVRVLVLDPPADQLRPRLVARVEAMLAGGLVDETRRIIDRYGSGLRCLGAVGYREVRDHLVGPPLPEGLPAAILRATVRYARRQRTWFRKEPGAEPHGSGEVLVAAALAEDRGSAL